MSDDNDVVERIRLEPDSALVHALGTHHSLESSIADLIDNSLDAQASSILVRLITRDKRLIRVDVVDDGRGMDARTITDSMVLGKRRDYGSGQLGHFGMGLKAASLGHANVLTVWSQSAGATPVGRRLRKADFSRDFSCEVLSSDGATHAEAERRALCGGDSGTMVTWTELSQVFHGHSDEDAISWLKHSQTRVMTHLAVTFHRLIEQDSLSIDIVIADESRAHDANPTPVFPIDPFGYRPSGHPSYPKDLLVQLPSGQVKLTCHIWPAKSDITGFRIGNKPGEQFQGFYVYRHDRLLQLGGWGQVVTASSDRQLARVIIDDPQAIGSLVTMNPEKSGLRFDPAFGEAVEAARADDGITFSDFLTTAEAMMAKANRRNSQRAPAPSPYKGFAPELRDTLTKELPLIEGRELQVRWRILPDGQFFDIDLDSTTVMLNSAYRALLGGGGGLNDAPVIKALIFLLMNDIFTGSRLGKKDKDNIALWQSVLASAVADEAKREG
ncbi:ATP-binding protein [Ornithinimicrobium sp. Arc0846-15]|nr:ATP-binding protein [Ornithinimicrobium laminariae]